MYDPVKLVLLNNPPNGFGFVSFSSFYGYFGSNHMIYLYFTEKYTNLRILMISKSNKKI